MVGLTSAQRHNKMMDRIFEDARRRGVFNEKKKPLLPVKRLFPKKKV